MAQYKGFSMYDGEVACCTKVQATDMDSAAVAVANQLADDPTREGDEYEFIISDGQHTSKYVLRAVHTFKVVSFVPAELPDISQNPMLVEWDES